MLKDFYQGCSVELKNGQIIHNVWMNEKAEPYWRYIAVEIGVKPKLIASPASWCNRYQEADESNILAWDDEGKWDTDEPKRSIKRVIPKSEEVTEFKIRIPVKHKEKLLAQLKKLQGKVIK